VSTTSASSKETTEIGNSEPMRFQYKVVLLGEGGVGKTALVRRYCFNEFSTDTQLTIGLSFHSVTLQAKQGSSKFRIGLSIWDFGGQQRFRPLLPQFIYGANAALLVFDLGGVHTLENLRGWKKMLIENITEKIPIHLVGTKLDLIQETPSLRLDPNVIKQYVEELGATKYTETSAKEKINTDTIFKELVRILVNQKNSTPNPIEIL